MKKTILNFKEKYKNESQIDHIVDFLKAEYGNKKSINFNYEQALEKANLWTQKLNEKNKWLKSSGDVEIIKDFGSGFRIVRLIDQESKNWEGLHMNHCVSSYTDHQGIYSLRDSKNLPHCTIEVANNEIKQIKGNGNGLISPKYVNYVLDFLQSINFEISNDDIENLGYTNNIDLNFIKEHFANCKIIKIKNEEFLYVGNQLKLIKNFDSKDENLLIHFCEFNQCFDAIKLLVKNNTNINSDYFEFDKGCPLSLASEYGHLNIVKFLVEKGANIHVSDDAPLICASHKGHLDIVKFLIENDANIHSRNDDPLVFASLKGHLDVVKYLVEKGANIHAQEDYSLCFASKYGHLDIVRFLVENGADIHSQYDYSLRWASNNKHLNVVKFLVEKGANIHSQIDCSLIVSNYNSHLSVAERLVEKGSKIS